MYLIYKHKNVFNIYMNACVFVYSIHNKYVYLQYTYSGGQND